MNNRRCTGDVCLAKAGARSVSLDLPVATVLMNPRQEWNMLAHGGRARTARELDVNWKKYSQDNYLMSHCTIVASVKTEDNGYYILPACSELVNNNGNAWTNEVLLATFRSFVGGENYLEHVQVPELSKGKILDAVIRPVRHISKNTGKEADIYYVDILVATSRKHDSLVSKIASGELTTMSMGCLADWVTCSRCGKVLGDSDSNCKHLDHQMLQTFEDENGIERVVAELCGRMVKKGGIWVGDGDSLRFIEASWVERPAFTGAVLNHYVSDISREAARILEFPTWKLAETMDDMFKLRVADTAGMISLRVARAEMSKRMMDMRERKIAFRIMGSK